jgi:hypothetical protein
VFALCASGSFKLREQGETCTQPFVLGLVDFLVYFFNQRMHKFVQFFFVLFAESKRQDASDSEAHVNTSTDTKADAAAKPVDLNSNSTDEEKWLKTVAANAAVSRSLPADFDLANRFQTY